MAPVTAMKEAMVMAGGEGEDDVDGSWEGRNGGDPYVLLFFFGHGSLDDAAPVTGDGEESIYSLAWWTGDEEDAIVPDEDVLDLLLGLLVDELLVEGDEGFGNALVDGHGDAHAAEAIGEDEGVLAWFGLGEDDVEGGGAWDGDAAGAGVGIIESVQGVDILDGGGLEGAGDGLELVEAVAELGDVRDEGQRGA